MELTLVEAGPDWAATFALEAQRVGAALPPGTRLHHIGSTAVPGLLAKPILDMLAEVPRLSDLDDAAALERLGFEAMGADGLPGRRYFRRTHGGRRTHHLHCWRAGDAAVARHLAVRDLLRRDAAERAGYAAEKRRVAALPGIDQQRYHDEKSPYVRQLEARALAQAEGAA